MTPSLPPNAERSRALLAALLFHLALLVWLGLLPPLRPSAPPPLRITVAPPPTPAAQPAPSPTPPAVRPPQVRPAPTPKPKPAVPSSAQARASQATAQPRAGSRTVQPGPLPKAEPQPTPRPEVASRPNPALDSPQNGPLEPPSPVRSAPVGENTAAARQALTPSPEGNLPARPAPSPEMQVGGGRSPGNTPIPEGQPRSRAANPTSAQAEPIAASPRSGSAPLPEPQADTVSAPDSLRRNGTSPAPDAASSPTPAPLAEPQPAAPHPGPETVGSESTRIAPKTTPSPHPSEQARQDGPEAAAAQPGVEADGLAGGRAGGRDQPDCAVVVDARGLSPRLSPSPSPAVLDPSGKKVWPNSEAVKGISSNLVNKTSIALFFEKEAEVAFGQYTRTLKVRAEATKPSEFATSSKFNDYVMVSKTDAERIQSAGLTCQMIFLR
ncbi:hypothetical protein [Meiothermus sp. Pnk-1]|uniref:hypothetical protein n=1 Tax=Meiothermus sp. Pnk-1 TaxID=873128 RepID=UPI000D7BB645|nr:hypothetical protein [Meiothermus sp. Pnk-1]PZA06985.1 hypothetical protein DNA98_09965 [Meiothermus sp. Pnk-1]